MRAQELLDLTAQDLIDKIQLNKGLNQFAVEKSKFECWLKVELINVLINKDIIATPEKSRIDVSFEDTSIELKTVNTNYRYETVKNKTRPITKNVSGILKDIADLKEKEIVNRFVVFIVFPIKLPKKEWLLHIQKIKKELSELVFKEFTFENLVPAIIYYGKI